MRTSPPCCEPEAVISDDRSRIEFVPSISMRPPLAVLPFDDSVPEEIIVLPDNAIDPPFVPLAEIRLLSICMMDGDVSSNAPPVLF